MGDTLRIPQFTAMGNLEGALTGAIEECEEALLSYRDTGIDHPYIPTQVHDAMGKLAGVRDYLQTAKAGSC